jgi:hypothetical protein
MWNDQLMCVEAVLYATKLCQHYAYLRRLFPIGITDTFGHHYGYERAGPCTALSAGSESVAGLFAGYFPANLVIRSAKKVSSSRDPACDSLYPRWRNAASSSCSTTPRYPDTKSWRKALAVKF